ncbi:MAG: STAS domain-containing protein, partial [Candidatus Eremiobacterota bacterium]
MISIRRTDQFGFPILQVSGVLDFYTFPGLLQQIRGCLDAQPRRLGLDLSRVTRLDLAGLSLLLTASEWLAGRGSRLDILGTSPEVLPAVL